MLELGVLVLCLGALAHEILILHFLMILDAEDAGGNALLGFVVFRRYCEVLLGLKLFQVVHLYMFGYERRSLVLGVDGARLQVDCGLGFRRLAWLRSLKWILKLWLDVHLLLEICF